MVPQQEQSQRRVIQGVPRVGFYFDVKDCGGKPNDQHQRYLHWKRVCRRHRIGRVVTVAGEAAR